MLLFAYLSWLRLEDGADPSTRLGLVFVIAEASTSVLRVRWSVLVVYIKALIRLVLLLQRGALLGPKARLQRAELLYICMRLLFDEGVR